MFNRFLKVFGVVALCAGILFGAIEFWVYRNREKIFRTVQEIVNENLNGNLEVGDFKFRPFQGSFGLNFTLSNVSLTDSLFEDHKQPFFLARRMHVSLDLQGFYKGNIKIKNMILEDGGLVIFTRRDGYSNLTIFQSDNKKKKDKKSGNSNLIEKLGNLRFVNFKVNYADSLKKKYYGALFRDVTNILAETDTTTNLSLTGPIYFDGLTFRPDKGGFLVKQETNLALALAYDADKQRLTIYPSVLESSTRDKIGINGQFDFSDTLRNFTLNFEAKKIAVKDALPLLTKVLKQQIDSLGVQTTVDTKVKVAGQLSPGDPERKPHVEVYFVTDTFNYALPVGTLRRVKAFGTFTNQMDSTKTPNVYNSRITVPRVSGFFETIPFSLKLTVNDFRNPRAALDGRVEADSTNIGQLLDPGKYRFKKGTAKIDFHFRGSLKNFYNPDKDKFDGRIWGLASMNNLAMDYLPRNVSLSKINGEFTFNEKAVVFSDLHFSDGLNMLYLRGKMIDLIPYLFGSPKPLRANVDINIPNWKLNWLETLLAPRQKYVRQNNKLKLSELLDEAIDKMQITAKLDSRKLQYRNFTASDVKGEFTVKDNAVGIEYFVMKAFGKGNVRVSGQMDNSGSGTLPHVAVKGKIENADVHSVFYSFADFGQKTITHENLKGILTTRFEFESQLTNNVKLVPATMRGALHFDLRNGHIINFEPFMKIKRLIFKKRNFENVELAPIRNVFRLKGQEIEIAPMEIESNVVTLYIDGIYSFSNKTDINIQIPLSNLKKRDSTYVLDPNNEEKKEGAKIYLRAIDEDGEVNIKLAFRRKKDKKKEEPTANRDEEIEK